MQGVVITGGLCMAALTAALVVGTPRLVRSQDADQIEKGEKVYNAQKCQVCHSIDDKGAPKQLPLDGVGSKLSAAEIREWIVEPIEMARKVQSAKRSPMPRRYDKLPAGEIDALVAYMQSLKE